MTKENILERLRAGEDPTVIGNELVAILNEAIADKKAEDEAKRKEEEAKAWQMKDAELLAEVMNDYFKKYCGATEDMVNAEGLVAAAGDLAKMLNVIDKVVETANEVSNNVNEVKATVKQTVKEPGKPAKTIVKTGQEAADWVEEVFSEFFKAFGI